MDGKLEILRRWAIGESPPPYIVDLNPTDDCNLRCRSCWMRNPLFEGKLDSKHYELPPERLLAVVEEGGRMGVGAWEITGGGEPTVRRAVTPELIRRIKKGGMIGNLTTNGTVFTAALIEEMVEIGWDKVVFSIDGYDDASNDYLRGRKGSLRKNVTALTRFRDVKGESRDKPWISFNTVLSSVNFDHMAEMIELAARVGCNAVNFEPITIHSPLGEALTLDDGQRERLPEYAAAAVARAERLGVSTNAAAYRGAELVEHANTMDEVIRAETDDGETDPFLSISCYEPWYHLVVKVDGQVGPCCLFNNQEMNIREHTLEEIWFGKYFSGIREGIIAKNFPGYCKICNAGQVLTNRSLRGALAEELARGDLSQPEIEATGEEIRYG